MELHIFHNTRTIYRETEFGLEDDGDEGYYKDIEVSGEELVNALAHLTARNYGFYKLVAKADREQLCEAIASFIADSNLDEDEEYLEGWRDELEEYFREED